MGRKRLYPKDVLLCGVDAQNGEVTETQMICLKPGSPVAPGSHTVLSWPPLCCVLGSAASLMDDRGLAWPRELQGPERLGSLLSSTLPSEPGTLRAPEIQGTSQKRETQGT